MFLLAFVAMVAIGASAQMNVWENGGLSAQYAIENVDSVTFGITSETPSSGTGKDGITPLLKIENDYWYVSYDEGQTWQQEGRAKGKDGQDGDSMFQSVTHDENYVYFTLADGTVIKIAKEDGNNQSNDDFIFTVTYDPNGGEGVMEKDTFYYGYADTLSACEFEREGHFFIAWNTSPNGTGASYEEGYSLNIDRNIILYAQWETYTYVDLGLSVKWATTNVGAVSPEDYGDYFAWGEVEPKTRYYKSDYLYVANSTTLPLINDAARVNWGGNWRMPTKDEIIELCEQCTWTWTILNGVNGYKVTSKQNGKSIFLPAAGYRYDTLFGEVGSRGRYWSSSLSTDVSYALHMYFLSSGSMDCGSQSRYYGYSVRPVCP